MADTILTFQYGRARRARSVAYGVLGRICFPRTRVTLESARQVTFRFSVLGWSFLVLSSASDSRSPEMPSCRVSRQAMPSVRSSTCYTKVARTRFGYSPAASSAATVISGDDESGRKILAIETALSASQSRIGTVLQLVLGDVLFVFGASCSFRCARRIVVCG